MRTFSRVEASWRGLSYSVHDNQPDQHLNIKVLPATGNDLLNDLGRAVEIAQVSGDQIAYIENTAMFVDIAWNLGIRSIRHTDYETTRRGLAAIGLHNVEGQFLNLASLV